MLVNVANNVQRYEKESELQKENGSFSFIFCPKEHLRRVSKAS
jgi:hypothetical protein